MAQVLIDTSVWIEFFNQPASPEKTAVDSLIDHDQGVTAGPILSELLQGVKKDRSRQTILDHFEALPYVEVGRGLWIQAGQLGASLRRRGITVPLTDLVIATLAQAYGFQLYSLDHHFGRIPHLMRFVPAG